MANYLILMAMNDRNEVEFGRWDGASRWKSIDVVINNTDNLVPTVFIDEIDGFKGFISKFLLTLVVKNNGNWLFKAPHRSTIRIVLPERATKHIRLTEQKTQIINF